MPFLRRDTLALALVRRFAAAFAPAFLAVHATVGALALAYLRAQAPGLAWAEALELAGDALVAGFDVTVTGVAVAAACIVVHGAAARGQLLAVALAGRAPWRPFGLTIAVATLLAGGLWWWVGHATPQALYRLRYPVADAARAVSAMRAGELLAFGDWTAAVGSASSDGLRDVALARTEAATATALVAASATLGVTSLGVGAATLDAELRAGRWLVRDPQRVVVDAGFERLVLSTDARTFVRPEKSSLLPLGYYRDDELPRYREQALARLRVGAPVEPAEARRGDAIPLALGLRAAAAAQPLIGVVVVVALLARPRPRRRTVAVAACAAVAVGLLARVALEARVGKVGDLHAPWIALLPPLATLALAAPFAWRRGGEA